MARAQYQTWNSASDMSALWLGICATTANTSTGTVVIDNPEYQLITRKA